MTTPSLLNWIMDLLRDDSAREAFHANPQAAMASAGFSAACGDDVRDARAFIADNPHVGHKYPAHQDHNHGRHGNNDDDHQINIRNINNNHNENDNDAAGEVQNILNTFVFAPVIVVPAEEDPVLLPEDDLGAAGAAGDPEPDGGITDSANSDTDAGSGGVVDQSGSVVGDDQVGRDVTDTEIGDGSAGGDLTETEIEGDGNVGRDDNSVEVEGDGNAGRDINNTTTVGEDATAAGGDMGEAEGGLLGLNDTVDTGDINVLSDLTGDILQDDNLNDLTALTDFESLADVTGPLL